MNLQKLIKGCQRRNLNSQRELYQNYKDDLFVLCLKYCRNKEEAQDNLQDAFLTIFEKIRTYNGKGTFEGWMKRVVINKAIDKYKNDMLVPIEINNDLLEDSTLDQASLHTISLQNILRFVQELPNKYRLIFNLYELDDYSHDDISKLLNISIGTSKSNLHRAKKILQHKILELQKSSIKTVNAS